MKGLFTIIILLSTLLFSPDVATAASKKGERGAFLRSNVSREKVTVGETLMYEVILFTPDPRVEGIELLGLPEFTGMDVRRTSPDSQLQPVEIDGQKYYRAVVDRYFLHFPEQGKFRIKGGTYRLGLYRPQEYYDPFWGRSVGNVVDAVSLSAPEAGVKAVALPKSGRPSDFSGAVGDFEIMAEFPGGKLRNGEDALLSITISGMGSLDGVTLPDIPSALPEGLQFKSLTDNVSHFVKDGELGSEVEIECIVMPKREGEFVIDSLRFIFFNSHTGRYETVTAPPIKIEAGSGLPGSGKPAVIMEI